MIQDSIRSLAWCSLAFAVAGVAGCEPDGVKPGYYGADDDAAAAVTSESPPPATADDASTAASGGDDGGAAPPLAGDASGPTATQGCDLSGRWLATDREVATAVGAKEASHAWLYYEIAQTGSQLTVTKGLDCGETVIPISAVGANVDYQKTWPAILTKDTHTGRKGTSTSSASGCAVTFAKQYEIIGATVAAYTDPSLALPMPSQEAVAGTPGTPGWEDWDNDGHPGYTMNVTGLATGQIYCAVRKWSSFSGTVPTGSNSFTLADDWGSEQDLLGYNGSELLTATAEGTRDNDDSEHFVTFVRLGATQATGDDATTCAAVRMLAPGLTPKASM